MKTLRYIPCPCCGHSQSASSFEQRPVGRFKVDVRLCQGRKGFPSIGFVDMDEAEVALVRQRLLATLQSALTEGVISVEDLELLAPAKEARSGQLPLAIRVSAQSPVGVARATAVEGNVWAKNVVREE